MTQLNHLAGLKVQSLNFEASPVVKLYVAAAKNSMQWKSSTITISFAKPWTWKPM